MVVYFEESNIAADIFANIDEKSTRDSFDIEEDNKS